MSQQETQNTVKSNDLPAVAAILRELANGLDEAMAEMKNRGVDRVEATNWKTAQLGLKYMKGFSEALPGLIRYAKLSTDFERYAVDKAKQPVVKTKPAEAVAKSKKKASR
jgi:hypothetical protein